MSFRTAYGLTHSENGWRMCNRDECDLVRIPNLFLTDTAPLRKGAPLTILGAWLYWYDRNVEEIGTPVWGWSNTNDVASSNHLSGTAVDVNAPKYPWGARVMPQERIAKIREGLRLFEGTVFWGADWSRADEMHYQMGYREGDQRNEAFAAKLRAGYLGIYGNALPTPAPAPQPAGGLTVDVFADAMGNSLPRDRYAALLPAFVEAMHAAQITTVNRAAMWFAQLGHESGGLRWMQEIADGSAYEGRRDLGNTQPGDGRRFKGHGPIQVTGRHNHAECSKWAHARGLVPTPTYFVDHPDELAGDRYGFIGPVWYWIAARPQLNALSDARDLDGATRAINGGLNGIDDRRARWNRCLALGDRLLPPPIDSEEFLMSDTQYQSLYVDENGVRSTFKADLPTYVLLNDAKVEQLVKNQAKLQDQIAAQGRIIAALGKIAGV